MYTEKTIVLPVWVKSVDGKEFVRCGCRIISHHYPATQQYPNGTITTTIEHWSANK